MGAYVYINEIFFALIEGLFILLVHLLLTNKKDFLSRKKLKSSVFVLCYTIFSFWSSISIPVGYHTIVIVMFSIFTLAFITESRLIPSLVSVIIVSIYFMIIEFLVFFILRLVFQYDFNDIFNNSVVKMQFSITAKVLEGLIILFSYRIKLPIMRWLSSSHSNTTFYYSALGVFFMGVFFFSLDYIVTNAADILLYQTLLLTIFFIYIILGALDYREKLQLLAFKQRLQLQSEHAENLETIINIIRREKHDFSNHINTVYAMCVLNKPNTVDSIKNYLEKISFNLKSSYHFYNSGNDYIDGLLAVKSNFAFENDIFLDVDFEEPLTRISVTDNDLISIVSNIIDNGFDALLSQSELEGKIISISTYIENNTYHLSISNNGPMIPEGTQEKIFHNGFSTKVDKQERGLGLAIVKQIVDKNKGKISVQSSNEETEFLIKFRVKSGSYGKSDQETHKVNRNQQSPVRQA